MATLSDTQTYVPGVDPKTKYYGPPPIQVRAIFGAATHVGLVRANNEDHYAVVQRYRTRRVLLTNVANEHLVPTQEEAFALSVADGMGGAACGEIASRLALSAAWHWGGRESRWLMNVADLDESAIDEQLHALGELLNEALVDRARLDPSTAGMGTTLTIVYTVGRHAFVAHIGDSRAYRIRGESPLRLSSDHTLAEELRAAGVPEHQAQRKRHVLTNCLNSKGDPVYVEWRHLLLELGDWLLLCTDGLTDLVNDAEIAHEVRLSSDPQSACDRLVKLALARGGKDNVTVVAGQYLEQEPNSPTQ